MMRPADAAASDGVVHRIPSDEQYAEFARLIGDEPAARQLMTMWIHQLVFTKNLPNGFCLPESEQMPDAEQRKRLQTAQRHAEALVPLLDDGAARLLYWTTGNREFEAWGKTERRLKRFQERLARLAKDLGAAADSMRVAPGKPLRPTTEVVLTGLLLGRMREAGVPDSTAENSRMVRATRICWDIAGFPGDARDLLRRLATRKGEH